jgi:putative aldouronate transport system permease protein
MLLPVVIYYLVFYYAPMYGVIIAFKDFTPSQGIWASPWVGLNWFKDFFNSFYSWRIIRNTFLINFYDVLFGFPAPIILALFLNELTSEKFKRWAQTVSYMPHFISVVVTVGLVLNFTAQDGLFNSLITMFGGTPIPFMTDPRWFRTIYVGSGIWQSLGWGSIVYLAALTNIDPTLYEAATVDGAGRWNKLFHITLPGIAPVIIIMLILRVGTMMAIGYEKIILMYNPMLYETADVISTFVYRKGLLQMNYSFSAAVDLFNSLINFILLVSVNQISKKLQSTSLW